MNLVELLSIEPSQRKQREINSLENMISDLAYFEAMGENTHKKLYQIILRGMAMNCQLSRFQKGQFLWKIDDKQDQIMIVLEGTCRGLSLLSQEDLQNKRSSLMELFPKQSHLFIDRPGRQYIIGYDQDQQLNFMYSDKLRMRRSCFNQEHSPQKTQNVRRSESISRKKESESFRSIPKNISEYISKEVSHLLDGVMLYNAFHISSLFEGGIVRVQIQDDYVRGDLLNQDTSQKKHVTSMFAIEDCAVLTISLSQFQSLQTSLNQNTLDQQYSFLCSAFQANLSKSQLHTIVKILMDKVQLARFDSSAIIFAENSTLDNLYIVKKGEFQIIAKKNLTLALVGPGSLLGEESLFQETTLYRCQQTSAESKLYSISISDFRKIIQKYEWFEQVMRQRSQIKQSWFQDRICSQSQMNVINTERTKQDEDRLMRQFIEQKEQKIINKFLKLKKEPIQEMSNQAHIANIIRFQKQIMLAHKQSKSKIPTPRTETVVSPQQSSTLESATSRQSSLLRKTILRRITQASVERQEQQPQNPLIPKLLKLDNNQSKILKILLNNNRNLDDGSQTMRIKTYHKLEQQAPITYRDKPNKLRVARRVYSQTTFDNNLCLNGVKV